MRHVFLTAALSLAACSPGAATAPTDGLRGLFDPALADRRAATELAVKESWPAILSEIEAGGGPALERAYDAAGVPVADRPARTLQLSGDLGLYSENPGALTVALSSFSGG